MNSIMKMEKDGGSFLVKEKVGILDGMPVYEVRTFNTLNLAIISGAIIKAKNEIKKI